MNPSIYRQFINQIISILDVDNVEICILLPILSVIKIFKLTLSQTPSPFCLRNRFSSIKLLVES